MHHNDFADFRNGVGKLMAVFDGFSIDKHDHVAADFAMLIEDIAAGARACGKDAV